jgi:hypothetical protein
VVSLVDAPLSRSFALKARVAFFVAAFLGAVVSALALSAVLAVPAAVVLGVLLGGFFGLVVALVVRAWPVLRVLWWWSFEAALLAVLLSAVALLASVTSPLVALLILVPLGLAVGLVPGTRRLVVAWWWCGVVRHRLRLCFAQVVRATGHHGAVNLPLMLLARPTPAGERVWVWLRPGLDLTDLEGKTAKLAVACWAGEVRVARASTRYAALLRVDITRRDPLTRLVGSPLAEMFNGRPTSVPVSPGMPPLGLDLDDVPEPAPEAPRSRR